MAQPGIAERSVAQLTQLSHLPPSFDGNPFLYAWALTSVMTIACLGIGVAGWMARDTWRDRYRVHPQSLLFLYRCQMGLCGFAAFFRAMPEVLYLQVYGDPDVSPALQGAIITAKRIADGLALWPVAAWVLIMVATYVPLVLALTTGPARGVIVDVPTTWPRLRRPAFLFVCIVLTAIAFAYGKVYAR